MTDLGLVGPQPTQNAINDVGVYLIDSLVHGGPAPNAANFLSDFGVSNSSAYNGNAGLNDNYQLVVRDGGAIVLTDLTTTVPEPTGMLIFGTLSAGLMARRRAPRAR